MRSLLKGQTVTVKRTIVSYVDGERVTATTADEVEGVLVCPGATSDAVADARPDADRTAYTLAFPKGYDECLRGALVGIDGGWYSVVGDPRPCRLNCPTRWWMTVEVEAVDG